MSWRRPAELQQAYADARALPGLFALQKEGETFLLLIAGPLPEGKGSLSVLDLRPVGGDQRLLAVLSPDPAGEAYPAAVVRLKKAAGSSYVARLTGPEGAVRELQGMLISDR